MNDYSYIAIDPGKATGVATYNSTYGVSLCTMNQGQVFTLLDSLPDNAFLIVERYIINARTVQLSRQYEALEIIGACKMQADRQSLPLRLHAPGERVPTQIIVDMCHPSMLSLEFKSQHEKDAFGHLFAFSQSWSPDDQSVFTEWVTM